MTLRNACTLLLSALLLVLPRVAAACPVCNANGDEESRVAFVVTTVFLSGLPVVMVGAGVWWVWRRIRAAELAPRPASPHRVLSGRGSAA